jgi:hypothetical protein
MPDAWSRDVGQDTGNDADPVMSMEDAGVDDGDALVCVDASC